MKQSKYNFTETQVMQFYDLYLGGLSCAQVAKQIGTTPSTLGNYFKKYNLPVENRQNKVNIDLDTLIKEYESGKSLTQIGKECGNTRTALSKMLKDAGIDVINQQNKIKFNENVFDTIDTEEKAYWLGFIYADGTISSHKEGKKPIYRFELTLAEEDIEHLNKFNKFMEHCENNVKEKPIKYKGDIKMSYRWSINNKHLWETLNRYGCVPNKSLILKFPDESIFKDKRLIIDFIRGYFDGDGCISFCDTTHTRPSISVLGTRDLLTHIDKYVFNDSTALQKNDKNNDITLVYTKVGAKAVAIMYMLYYKSNIYLNRKYNLFLQFKNCRFKAKALKLLEGKIGEGWDANPELIADLNDLQQCNA